MPHGTGTSYRHVEPFDTRRLPVGAPHELYVEQVGRPDGIPAVFLHGGPGGGCQAAHRQLFDPARFRAVLFDQRGAGRSTPRRCVTANTTQALVGDMELIRETLGIDRWMVVGGSWGATLALAYAEAHPERVTALVLRAVFLGTEQEVDWALNRGPRLLYPELWRAFVELLPEAERDDPLAAYGRRLEAPEPGVHGPAALVWHDYERALSVLDPGRLNPPDSLEDLARSPRSLPDSPFIESHFFKSSCFFEPDALMSGAARLRGIPGVIVQGRYDLLCPPLTALELAERWPDARVNVVEGAGHSLSEPGIRHAVQAGIEDFKQRLG